MSSPSRGRLSNTPTRLGLVTGVVELFRHGGITLLSPPGHAPGSQSLTVHPENTEYVILSGDVIHLGVNFERDIVPKPM
jgi:N-acyl homoserine lactone hydrolase